MKRIIFIFIGVLIFVNLATLFFRWVTLERAAETFLAPVSLTKPGTDSYPSAEVAIVIDDLGVKTPQYLLLMDLPYKLNLAIIPGLKNSKTLVKEMAVLDRYELLLHMPMEPFSHRGDQESQGDNRAQYPFYIDRHSNVASISSGLDAAMDQLDGWGFIKGLNNHMGSYVTSSPNLMNPILEWARQHQLYFLDSLTSRSSVAYEMARSQHIQSYHNEIFLDGVDDRGYIRDRLKKAVMRARSEGQVVAIGHITRKNTLLVLKEMMPIYADHGVRFVWLSELK
jgi:polysaccharide deacetylase 2 family uncharacterized protein YibQ